MDTIKINSRNTKLVAHRGVSGLETENTAAAFIAAGQRTHFGVETDVHVTLDGKIVCCHDSNLDRVAGIDMVIENTNYDELMGVCLYERGTTERRGYLRIPDVTDYISICKKYGKHCVPEIKGAFSEEKIGELLEAFKAYDMLDDTTFISFGFENLVKVRKLLPTQSVQYLVGGSEVDEDKLIEKLVEHKMDLDIYHPLLTEAFIEKLHANGIVVNCWTVDNKERAEQLAAWGVDQITSNILE